MLQQPARVKSERLIDDFVGNLSEVGTLDPDIITLVQSLHRRGQLNSRSLLKELASQREEWNDGEAA